MATVIFTDRESFFKEVERNPGLVERRILRVAEIDVPPPDPYTDITHYLYVVATVMIRGVIFRLDEYISQNFNDRSNCGEAHEAQMALEQFARLFRFEIRAGIYTENVGVVRS